MKVRSAKFSHIQTCGDLRDALPRMGYRFFWVRWGSIDVPVERRWVIETLIQHQDCGIIYEDSGRSLAILSIQ
ncbi:MAG: hypothetical protein C0620_10870 [Desulfuromonas sp.]|nr:MAG: hypothetical protein C0620_10870 [Desulfuromonas sp.]